MDPNLLDKLIEKFPAFSAEWSEKVAQSWFAGYERLLDLITGNQQLTNPATILPATKAKPGAVEEAVAAVRKHSRQATPEAEVAEMRRLADQGLSDDEIARQVGRSKSTVYTYLAGYRNPAKLGRERAAAPAGFQPPHNGTASGDE